MNTFLENVYANKLDMDTREPSYVVEIPGIEGTFGLLGLSLAFWIQLATFLMLQSILCIVIACIVYNLIIHKRGTSTSFLIGYGFVIPFVLVMPFKVIPFLDIRNMCLMISIASTPILVIFRCLEAMHRTSPPVVEKDLVTYCIYYSSVIPFRFDSKTQTTIAATRDEVMAIAREYAMNVVMTSIFYSLLVPCSYSPFPSSRSIIEPIESLSNLFHWGHLLNNYVLACLTCLTLDGGTLAVGLGINLLSGISTMKVMNNPLSKSSSPSDFWGRRWNLMLHGLLKRGIYIPVSRHCSKTVAAAVTFLASGLLHEYVLAVISLKGNLVSSNGAEPYRPSYGMHMAFFMWNGLMMTIEYSLKASKPWIRVPEQLPRPMMTALVLMTVLPVSHWFTDEYVRSGLYADFSIGFPRIVRISNGI